MGKFRESTGTLLGQLAAKRLKLEEAPLSLGLHLGLQADGALGSSRFSFNVAC